MCCGMFRRAWSLKRMVPICKSKSGRGHCLAVKSISVPVNKMKVTGGIDDGVSERFVQKFIFRLFSF